MKSINAIVHLILFAAIVVLYILHFTSSGAKPVPTAQTDSLRVKLADLGNEKDPAILFVNSDTLWANYEYVKTLEESVVEERKKLEAQFAQRQRKWENDMKELQTRYQSGQMTMEAAAAREEELLNERDKLVQLQEELTMKLMKSTEEKNKLLEDAILSYLHKYNLDKNVNYVLGYQRGGMILFGRDSLDITDEVLQGLNAEYQDSLSNAGR